MTVEKMNLLTLLVCICLIFFKASATEVIMHRMDIQRTGIILDAKGPTNPELKWKYGGIGEPNLLLTKGRLCFADKSEYLHLVDIQTGQAIWKLAGPIGTPSIAKDSKLYVATAKQMICVDLESQKILWKFPKDGSIKFYTERDIRKNEIWGYPLNPDPPLKKLRELYNPVIVKNEGRVYFGTGRKEKVEFCCVNLKDGASVWTFTEEGVVGCQGFSRSQPIVAEGRVFFATLGGGIYCLGERTGK